MINQNQIEEIISLIDKGFDLNLLSFELDIPIQQVQEYEKQLQLRRFAKESIKNGKIETAIEKLNTFIQSTENNIVEKTILLKLQAYVDKTNVNEQDLKTIDEERKNIGFSGNIDEILDDLKVQIPRRRNSNLRKKERQVISQQQSVKEITVESIIEPDKFEKPNYDEIISKYKEKIAQKPQASLNNRNLLAFTYFRAGQIDKARDELISLIEQCGSHTAYRQLTYVEICEGNFEDAKLWAYDCLDKYPDSIAVREQLISIAKKEKNNKEILQQLREIIRIDPENRKGKEMLNSIKIEEGR